MLGGGDEGGGDEVRGHFRFEIEGARGDGEGWGDDGADHGEGVLEAEEECQEDRDAVI